MFKLCFLLIILIFSSNIYAFEKQTKSILFLGDSNAAIYGPKMFELLKSVSNNVNYYGLPGVRPYHFLNEYNISYNFGQYVSAQPNLANKFNSKGFPIPPKIDDLLKTHNPDAFVIALGGNIISKQKRKYYTDQNWIMLTIKDLKQKTNLPNNLSEKQRLAEIKYFDSIKKEVSEFIKKIPFNSRCIFISPPKGAKTHQKPEFFYEAIQSSLVNSNCIYFDGRVMEFSNNSKSDPIHYSKKAAFELAEKYFFNSGGIKSVFSDN